MGEFGLGCLSHVMSYSERDLVAHVYPVEQSPRLLGQQQHQRPLETVRNDHSQAHHRPIKSETLRVAQKYLFTSLPRVSDEKFSL